MKIVTVNVPESYLETIEKLCGNNGLFPSRSELIRTATRDFLKKELKQFKKEHELKSLKEYNEKNKETVKVPVNQDGDFIEYKILRRLES